MLDKYIVTVGNLCDKGQLRLMLYDEYHALPVGLFNPVTGADTEEEAEALLKHIQEIGIQPYLQEVITKAQEESQRKREKREQRRRKKQQ